ncbi:uncharacterized protein DUF1538 [Salsuginibacillus halophilus]|uniref:Uncharacterized protein DUF1538 n=1 Tax=Salsuginibacillus halophilus TaxID=517424 RepID=A0A2P8HXN3_9BACI|nr:DUF1538 domain-containing protein [Salsuginibacillus halophilus]PSL50989.1 uncharacterized protein DUF1538 [Salsuginibacillus halophilus]
MGTLWHEFKETLSAVLPVTIVVILLQLIFVSTNVIELLQLIIGAVMTIGGLALFIGGAKLGLLPVGEKIGSRLPEKVSFSWIIMSGFLLGFVVTVAEPDVRILASQIDDAGEQFVSEGLLIASIALGVGVFVALAFLRKLLQIKLVYMLVPSYMLVFFVTLFVPEEFIAIAFDAGGVTTGPITVPFILALSIGISAVVKGGNEETSSDSFGLVAMASIGPILAVLILGVLFYD